MRGQRCSGVWGGDSGEHGVCADGGDGGGRYFTAIAITGYVVGASFVGSGLIPTEERLGRESGQWSRDG